MNINTMNTLNAANASANAASIAAVNAAANAANANAASIAATNAATNALIQATNFQNMLSQLGIGAPPPLIRTNSSGSLGPPPTLFRSTNRSPSSSPPSPGPFGPSFVPPLGPSPFGPPLPLIGYNRSSSFGLDPLSGGKSKRAKKNKSKKSRR